MQTNSNQIITITLAGEAGKGIQSVEHILTRALKLSGYHIFSTKEYMSRVRGGSNSTQIRVSSRPVNCMSRYCDLLLPMDLASANRMKDYLSENGLIIADTSVAKHIDSAKYTIISAPIAQFSKELGAAYYSNVILAGIICGILNIEKNILNQNVKTIFSKKTTDIVLKNLEAAKHGYSMGLQISSENKLSIKLTPNPETSNNILVNGSEAVGLGAIAGGCNFIASYPMSPSTGVLTYLSRHAKEFGIIAEQAEDEIAVINMALGAWYAGARALVTTSGGGFALMEEGISLAGITELPVVVHLAQRPGPGTGLPTRTEQGDLEMALYSGHGEFPRMIFAPGELNQAFTLTKHAFNMSDKYQIPVFILTDQYTMDTYYDIPELGLPFEKPVHHTIKTTKEYQRYALTQNGVSPRGIPSHGKGLVLVDSDEHDESGRITEDLELRIKMTEKRLKKFQTMKPDLLPPSIYRFSPETDKEDIYVICWGSTLNPVKKALEMLSNPNITLLHFSQPFPIPDDAIAILSDTKKIISIEGNATGQFSRILQGHYAIQTQHLITKFNGMQFTPEELVDRISKALKEVA